jgi:uncharacterized membrane protein YkvA (DUF1232 family)
MGKSTFNPYEFQRCTAAWAIERLFGKKHCAPAGRALIADEVGLGKTIVTKQVCDHLRTLHPRKNIQIVYMTSSLDICSQNRKKLSHTQTELVNADRITLLQAFKRRGAQSRVMIFSMTPGTSIQMGNLVGNTTERIYIAWLAQKLFHFGKAQACRVFALDAHMGFPKDYCQATFDTYQRLPREYWQILKTIWRNLKIGEKSVRDLISDRGIDTPAARAVVKGLRKTLVQVLLDRFNPDLIVLDEFQRFKDLLEVKKEGGLQDPLAARFLKTSTPTLLLSATPYRLWDSSVHAKANELPHQEDLKNTFAFLFDSHALAEVLMKDLEGFGQKLLNLKRENITDFYEQKKRVESAMKKVMARTERVNFIDQGSALTLPFFMSDSSHTLFDDELYEYLTLSGSSTSRQTLLSYWKSGSTLMSFMQDYQIRKQWLAVPKTRQNTSLWARFGKAEPRNVKLRYLLRDIFGEDSKNFSYLWVPPTRTYYAGHGVFDPKILASRKVKKGLVFSTWKFVPRMIAAELSHRRQFIFRRVKPKTNPLRATPVTWARFYFPSSFLAGTLSHTDFIRAKSYKKLLSKATSDIRTKLKSWGIEIRRGATGKPWQVLRYVDFQTKGSLDPALKAYRKHYQQGLKKDGRKGRSFEDRYLHVWEEYEAKPAVTLKTIDALARIAIGSPSVCLLRTLELLHGKLCTETREWSGLLEHCIHDIRNYLNRSMNQEVITSSFPKGSYAVRVEAYFTAGNFQALLDEYLSLCDVGSEFGPILDSIGILRMVLGGNSSGSVTVPVNAKGKPSRVTTDVAIAFGEGNEISASRDSVRVGFNSPFWPMVLATTSIGQEGLDFHLYCKDIYHWNLPSNPVAFEQREGRINRFNGLMVRKNLVANQPLPAVREGEHLWSRYFEEAPEYCVANDRYNLGLSPHWIYTPKHPNPETAFQRHILDLPNSDDRRRYELLMTDLTNYRLALGQPDQNEFLKKVRDNTYLANTDTCGLALYLFPVEYHEVAKDIKLECFQLKRLVQDARAYLDLANMHPQKRELRSAVERCIRHVEEFILARSERKTNLGLKAKAARVVEALRYLVDPHDKNNDRMPEIGFDDDLNVLQKAAAFLREKP